MNHIIFSPRWFFDYDILFDLLSAFVTLIVALYANKLYKYSSNKRYKLFSISFFLIGLGYIGKSLTNFVVYHPIQSYRLLGGSVVMYSIYVVNNIPFILGFLTHRLLLILGFLGIYLTLTKYRELFYNKGGKGLLVFIIYLIIITTIFSWSQYYVFHASLLLLGYCIFMYYMAQFRKKKKKLVRLNALAFLIIFISQLMFLFVELSNFLYFLGELAQLIAYMIMAYIFYKILKV